MHAEGLSDDIRTIQVVGLVGGKAADTHKDGVGREGQPCQGADGAALLASTLLLLGLGVIQNFVVPVSERYVDFDTDS